MNDNEKRYRAIACLLQAAGPQTLEEVVAGAGLSRKEARAALGGLVQEGLVVEGELVAGQTALCYRWAARWQEEAGSRAADAVRDLSASVGVGVRGSDVEDEAVLAFHDFVINTYRPPSDKRFLVFLQCSVRRPFWKSPSHGSMRRAISTATGYDPAREFALCPVHVVVLASRIGPVPYDLADVYPANVGGGGVKHFGPDEYERARPILARRMADYIDAHGACYEHTATFTDGRYGEVMALARDMAGADFPIFPRPDGPRVLSMGKSRPRTYWAKFWIQLYLEIATWLSPAERKAAAARLRRLAVDYTSPDG